MEKEVRKFLKKYRCKVMDSVDGALLFFFEGFYGALFFDRKHADELKWFSKNSFGAVVNKRNWPKIKEQLQEMLK